MKRQEIIYSLDISGADAELELTIYEDGSANIFVGGLEGQYFTTLVFYLFDSNKNPIFSQTFNYIEDAFVFEGDIEGFTFQENTIYNFYITITGYSGAEYRFPDYGSYYEISTFGNAPLLFEWEMPKVSGKKIRISASEWNAFLDKINEVREYQGLTEVSFTKALAYSLDGRNVVTKSEADNIDPRCIISYENIRQAVDAILGSDTNMGIPIDNEYSDVIDLQKGDNLSAVFSNGLRDAINSAIE